MADSAASMRSRHAAGVSPSTSALSDSRPPPSSASASTSRTCLPAFAAAMAAARPAAPDPTIRSEEHTSELQSLMRIAYAVSCLKKKTSPNQDPQANRHTLIHYYPTNQSDTTRNTY